MVNIIVMMLSPLGDYLCLSNTDTVNLEASPAQITKNKRFSFLFLKCYSMQHAALI